MSGFDGLVVRVGGVVSLRKLVWFSVLVGIALILLAADSDYRSIWKPLSALQWLAAMK